MRDLLAEQEIAVGTEQVLLTHGSSQAMDLVARRLVRPGDAVLVDDPGYPNLLFSLRFLGARLIGVPRTPAGYDLVALERLVLEHQPKVFFTQPRLQSPTGSVAQLAHLHRVVQLAEKHDFLVVENDIYADLDPEPRPSLASLDQLQRVIYISSFSKTISPNIRVGYLAASPDLLEDLAQLKMISGPDFVRVQRAPGLWCADRRALAQAHQGFARAAGGGPCARGAALVGDWALSCLPSPRRACACGPDTRKCTMPPSWPTRRANRTFCWDPAICLAPNSGSAPGYASTWRIATMSGYWTF